MTSNILRNAFDSIKSATGAEYLFGTFYNSEKALCCGSCAGAELASHGFDTGFFFHEQSAERVVDSGKLSIGYFAPTHTAKMELGFQIAQHLLDHGFTIDWDGNPDVVIFVSGFTDWDPEPWEWYDDEDDWDDYYDDEDYLQGDPDF